MGGVQNLGFLILFFLMYCQTTTFNIHILGMITCQDLYWDLDT